ncbi:MAG: GAF domain-containing protein [Chloroflexi bacterium]|nr:MAG: GAF domain-containing protein [Chloroflexota bacterium]
MVAPTKKLITVLFFVFIGEAAVMALINVLNLPPALEAFVDASALIMITLPILYIQLVKPLIQQNRATEEARQTTQLMLDAGTELSQSLELDEVIQVLFRHVNRGMPFECAAVYLINSSSELISRAAWRCGGVDNGNDQSEIESDYQDIPLFLKTISEGKSITVPDAAHEEGWVAPWAPGKAQSWVGIPLITGGKVFGLSVFNHPLPNVFSRGEIELAEGLVGEAAAAIQNARLFEEVNLSNERIKYLTHKTVEIQERERRILAKDLYDDVGQEIVSVLLQLRLLEDKINQPEVINSQVTCLDQELSSILDKLHTMAFNLRPASLDHLGLVEAVRQDLDKLSEENNLQINFESTGITERLPERIETILYRIIQEALTNVVKHARATRLDVYLKQQDNELMLIMEDNGVGFEHKTITSEMSFGISGMQERTEMIAGKFSIESSQGNGTAIFVTVPNPIQHLPV